MTSLKSIWDCMFSPKLVKIYGNGPLEKLYEPNTLEKWGDQVINSLYIIWKIGVYTSPVLAGMLYYRGYCERECLITLTKLVTGVGVVLIVSFCMRGFGRAQNLTYQNFINIWERSRAQLTPRIKEEINKYDFEFWAWPVEYTMKETRGVSRSMLPIRKPVIHQNLIQCVTYVPLRVIAYIAIHTFGIRMVYPGVLGFLQAILAQSLLQGRSKLVEIYRGERFKVKTIDHNEIDTMFVDRRNATPNGNTLVICCEGNAGFYEIGVAITPIEAGYSVLGWNHPGFGGSTGLPYPDQEINAIDTVVQFAIEKLGFRIENIIFFAWSIGGYSSSWAAMSYPDCKGVVLDATFDDLLPLALNHMPRWWAPIVTIAIRNYVDLNVVEQLLKYPGPVLLIRRTEDEVICLRDGVLSSNRGNNLLIKLLRHRYPYIFEEHQTQLLEDYLAVTGNSQENILRKYSVDDNMCMSLLQSYISEYSKSYPMKIGMEFNNTEKSQMALFLAKKYMKDFKSTHCVNLPAEMFQMPWDVNVEADFVFT